MPPQSSAIIDAIKVTTIACRENGFQNAKPSSLAEKGKENKYNMTREARYTDAYVTDVQKGVKSCKVEDLEWIDTD